MARKRGKIGLYCRWKKGILYFFLGRLRNFAAVRAPTLRDYKTDLDEIVFVSIVEYKLFLDWTFPGLATRTLLYITLLVQ